MICVFIIMIFLTLLGGGLFGIATAEDVGTRNGMICFIILTLLGGGAFLFSTYGSVRGWNEPHIKNKKAALKYCQKILQVIKELRGQLPELRQNYTGNLKLIDKWENAVWEVGRNFTKKTNNSDATEARESLSFIQEVIRSGVKRIRNNENPFDDAIFPESDEIDYIYETQNGPPLWYTVLGTLFFLPFYIVFCILGMGVFVLTMVWALGLFPNSFPVLEDQQREIRHIVGFIILGMMGFYLNRIVISHSTTIQLICAVTLPIIYGVIYWVVKNRRQVKEL